MADVFMSYCTEDREIAERLAASLSGHGWTVWWDRRIVVGDIFDKVIERELESAKAVVALWSERSVHSEWVRNEAAAAAARGALIPVRIDAATIPLEFRRKQTGDLMGWDGEESHPGYQALCAAVAAKVSGSPPSHTSPQLVVQRAASRRTWIIIGAVIALLAAVATYILWPSDSTNAARDTSADSQSAPDNKPNPAIPDLAALIAGTYVGGISADSQGSSRSDVVITVTRLDRTTVRITSDYKRIGTTDVSLTRIGEKVFNADTNSVLIAEYTARPQKIAFNPRMELAYSGTKVDASSREPAQ